MKEQVSLYAISVRSALRGSSLSDSSYNCESLIGVDSVTSRRISSTCTKLYGVVWKRCIVAIMLYTCVPHHPAIDRSVSSTSNRHSRCTYLPALGKVHLALVKCRVAVLDECEVLQEHTYVWNARRERLLEREAVVLVRALHRHQALEFLLRLSFVDCSAQASQLACTSIRISAHANEQRTFLNFFGSFARVHLRREMALWLMPDTTAITNKKLFIELHECIVSESIHNSACQHGRVSSCLNRAYQRKSFTSTSCVMTLTRIRSVFCCTIEVETQPDTRLNHAMRALTLRDSSRSFDHTWPTSSNG